MANRALILDSNSILSPDERKLVQPRIESLLQDCRELYPLDVFVPRVVLSEVAYRKCVSSEGLLRKGRNAEAGLAEILQIHPSDKVPNVPPVRFNLYRQYLSWCTKNKITIVPVPLARMNWKGLITDAIQRRPPFSEGDSEKGFRDTLIYHTALSVADQYEDVHFTIVTADKRFQKALEKHTEWAIANSVEEYLSGLKLEHSHVVAKRIEIFTTIASRVFFETNNQSRLFFKSNVLALIRRKFASQLQSIPETNVLENLVYFPERTTLERYTEDVVVVGPSLYRETGTDDRHSWNVTVAFLTLFESQIKDLPGMSSDLVRRTVFEVVWSAFISENGEFSMEAVNNVSFVSSIMSRASVLDLATYGFPTRFGRLSQSARSTEQAASDGFRVISPPEGDNPFRQLLRNI